MTIWRSRKFTVWPRGYELRRTGYAFAPLAAKIFPSRSKTGLAHDVRFVVFFLFPTCSSWIILMIMNLSPLGRRHEPGLLIFFLLLLSGCDSAPSKDLTKPASSEAT